MKGIRLRITGAWKASVQPSHCLAKHEIEMTLARIKEARKPTL